MYNLLIAIVIGLFVAMVFLNLYFRIKVFKVYKKLVQNKVAFGATHVFNKEKMAAEVLPRYPKQQADILTFVRHIHYSIRMASILAILITIFGGVLIYYR